MEGLSNMKKARIEPDTKAGLWLIIEGVEGEEVSWPLAEDEVKPILDACVIYLGKTNYEK